MKKYTLFSILSLLLVSVVLSGCMQTKELETIGNQELLEILNHRIEREDEEGLTLVTIKGMARNVGTETLLHADVRSSFYDVNGALMDTFIDSTSDLDPGETWNFEIAYFETEESKIENYELNVGSVIEAI